MTSPGRGQKLQQLLGPISLTTTNKRKIPLSYFKSFNKEYNQNLQKQNISQPKTSRNVPQTITRYTTEVSQKSVNTSFNYEATKKLKLNRQEDGEIIQRSGKGNIIGLACGPLKKQRYINPKIEKELVDFLKEVEKKFSTSKLRSYIFPVSQSETNSSSNDILISFKHSKENSMNLKNKSVEIDKQHFIPHINSHLAESSNLLNISQDIVNFKSNKYYAKEAQVNQTMSNTKSKLNNKTFDEKNTTSRNGYYKKDHQGVSPPLRETRFKEQNILPASVFKSYDPSQLNVSSIQDMKTKGLQTRYQNNGLSALRGTTNIINMNNPQLFIDSPQNNTIILVAEGQKNMALKHLQQKGKIKFDQIKRVFNLQSILKGNKNNDKSFESPLQSYRTSENIKQQQQVFSSYVNGSNSFKSQIQHGINSMGPTKRLRYNQTKHAGAGQVAKTQIMKTTRNDSSLTKSFIFPQSLK